MTVVVVERSFDVALPFDELVKAERAVSWCLEQHRVRPRISYQSTDGRRVLCLYEAPDAEAVRSTQKQGGLPFDAVWAALELGDGFTSDPRGVELVIAQRVFEPAITLDDLRAAAASSLACQQLYRVERVHSLLSTSGERQLCLFRAPDTESVRRVGVSATAISQAIWCARVASVAPSPAPRPHG